MNRRLARVGQWLRAFVEAPYANPETGTVGTGGPSTILPKRDESQEDRSHTRDDLSPEGDADGA